MREQYQRSGEEHIRVGRYEVMLRQASTFSYFMRTRAVPLVKSGRDARIPLGEMRRTYGAGPCIAGVALMPREEPLIFHYLPDQFRQTLPIFHAPGIIGGGVDGFIQERRSNPLESFFRLENGVLNMLVHHRDRYAVDIYYIVQ